MLMYMYYLQNFSLVTKILGGRRGNAALSGGYPRLPPPPPPYEPLVALFSVNNYHVLVSTFPLGLVQATTTEAMGNYFVFFYLSMV